MIDHQPTTCQNSIVSRAPASQATSSRIAGRHHLGISGRIRRNLHGMVTDKSASFHFHEDLARMTPEDQKKRVAELLEFAATLRVPGGDDIIDVSPDPEEEGEDGL